MATDNTTLNIGSGGDVIRAVAKTTSNPAKTQMVILDVGGGADGSAETALTLGAKTSSNSLSVVLASDQASVPTNVAAVASVITPTAASSLVLKPSAGALLSINAVATDAGGFLMLFDATSAPSDGAVAPRWCRPLDGSGIAYSFDTPLAFSTGIVAVFSTTGPFVKTASNTAYMSGQAR